MKQAILYIILLPCLWSCKKFVDIKPSPTTIEKRNLFDDEAATITAVTGIYAQAVASNLGLVNGGATVYPGLSADELYNPATSSSLDQFSSNVISPSNSTVQNNFWAHAYRFIYSCNAVLEGLNDAPLLKDSLKNQLMGEALCLRSFFYFYLVNLFGDSPLTLTTDFRANAIMPRTASAEIYSRIVQDLIDAKSKLNVNYPSAGRFRPNKWAAASLLARVYLYTEKWTDAEREATEVINAGMYQLLTDLNTVFLNSSGEVIWQIMKEASNAADGTTFIPSSTTTRPVYVITDTLLKAFSPTDKRRTEWMRVNTVSSVPYTYPFKYKQRQQTTLTESQVILRLAELFLIRAEARHKQNKPLDAIADLNRIRSRAGIALLPNTLTDAEVTLAIEKERKTELFAEWGHRWFDLKRWKKVDSHLSGLKTTWKSWAQWYPIPFIELQRNPFLIQNAGY